MELYPGVSCTKRSFNSWTVGAAPSVIGLRGTCSRDDTWLPARIVYLG